MDFEVRVNDVNDILAINKALPELKLTARHDFKVLGYHNEDGYMVAAITDYNGISCEISGMAKGKWFHPDVYADLFNYTFQTLECKRINFVVDKTNYKCIALLEKGGCVRECELRGVDKYLYSLTPEDFYGQASKPSIQTA